MATPKVSIVTPSFNQAAFLGQTLQSVRAQDYPNIEHIVVDGGSTDGSVDLLRAAPNIRWVSEPDKGQVDAIDKGFAMATGEILAWVNSDDTISPDAARIAVEALQRTGADLVYGDLRIIDQDGTHERMFYGIPFDYRVLLSTDAFFREIARQPEFQRAMSTAEFHYMAGRYVAERERILKLDRRSLLASAYKHAMPVYTSSPGDSSIGMNLAALELEGYELRIDPLTDVNETAAIVYAAKAAGMKSAVFILGGGSPKNFVLQTEPQIQEVMGVAEKGHDYFLQVTDARPDTGGLSGATPNEAVSWGKIDPDKLPDTVVCYVDSTVALPLITAYALARRKARKPRRLFEQRDAMMDKLKGAYEKVLRQRAKGKKS